MRVENCYIDYNNAKLLVLKSTSLASNVLNDINKLINLEDCYDAAGEVECAYFDYLFDEKLKAMPINRINRGNLGIRVSLLKQAGYDNIYDLYNASEHRLYSIPGIGPGNLTMIKRALFDIESDTEASIVIDPQNDDSKKMKEVILAYYKYFRLFEIKEWAKETYEPIRKELQKALNELLVSNISLRFNSNKRMRAVKAALIVETICSKNLLKSIETIKQDVLAIQETDENQAWHDFNNNRESYCRCLNNASRLDKVISKYSQRKPVKLPKNIDSEIEPLLEKKIEEGLPVANNLNVKKKKKMVLLIAVISLVIVSLISGIVIINNKVKKKEAEETKKIASFNDTITDTIKWQNFTFDNKLKLGGTFDEYLRARDNYDENNCKIFVYGSCERTAEIIDSTINKELKDYSNIINHDTEYNTLVMVSGDFNNSGEITKKYIIKTNYQTYIIAATVKEKDKALLNNFDSMITTLTFDDGAEQNLVEEAARETARKAQDAYDRLPDYPYHYLSMKLISNTKLGEPDEVIEPDEKTKKTYAKSHWFYSYKWYNDSGELIFEAMCMYNSNYGYNNSPKGFYVCEAILYGYSSDYPKVEIYSDSKDSMLKNAKTYEEYKEKYQDEHGNSFYSDELLKFWNFSHR